MIVKNKKAISRLPASVVFNCEDRKKFSAFIALMVAVNKRINPFTHELSRRRPSGLWRTGTRTCPDEFLKHLQKYDQRRR